MASPKKNTHCDAVHPSTIFLHRIIYQKNIYINQKSTNMPNTFAGSVKYSSVFVRTYEMLQAPRDDDIQTTGKMLL